MIALKVHYLTKQNNNTDCAKSSFIDKTKKSHDCTKSSFIDQKQKNANHDCTNSSFIDQHTNKVLIARKVRSLTKTKVMIARNVIIDQKQKS